MGTYINENGAYCYVRSGYQMQGTNPHHIYEHKSDIEAIVNELYEIKTKALVSELE